jgi:hypothetical protein
MKQIKLRVNGTDRVDQANAEKGEELYDRFSPRYWVTWGQVVEDTHRSYLQELLERVAPHGTILSAACGE